MIVIFIYNYLHPRKGTETYCRNNPLLTFPITTYTPARGRKHKISISLAQPFFITTYTPVRGRKPYALINSFASLTITTYTPARGRKRFHPEL